MLGISERSVNRILTGGTLTTERLFEILDIMGITLKDLVLMEEVEKERIEFDFTPEQEEYFVKNFQIGLFYSLLFLYDSAKELAKDYNLDDVTVGKMLSELEKQGLLKWLPGNEAELFEPRKFNTYKGPVYKSMGGKVANSLLEKAFKESSTPPYIFVPNLSENAFKKFQIKFKELFLEIKKEREIESLLKVPTKPVGILLCIEPYEPLYEELRNLRL
jgi:transcriptional regulator with XRE-family HTH domain